MGAHETAAGAGPLGPLVVLTDRSSCQIPLLAVVEEAIGAGARAILLREKDLPRRQRAAIGRSLQEILSGVGGVLLVASDVDLAREIGAQGVHLAARDPRDFDRQGLIIGVSCHDAGEVARAHAWGADYAFLSPIFETPSKPGYGPALGAMALGGHPLPVYALGGITAGRAAECLLGGASGLAVMGQAMRDPTCVSALLREIARVGRRG